MDNDELPFTETEALLAAAKRIAGTVLAHPSEAAVLAVFQRLCAEVDYRDQDLEGAGASHAVH